MTTARRRILAGSLLVLAAALAAWLWQARTVQLGTLAGAAVTPDSSPSARYVVERVDLSTTSGRTLACFLRRPAAPAAPAARLPAFLVSGGIRTGRRAVLAVDTTFTGIALSCDYAWRDPSDLPWYAFLWRLPRSRGEILATPRALDIAATWLLGRDDVDSARFAALGASLGVPPIAAWAANDPRPRAVALLYGGGDLGVILEANMRRRIRQGWLRRPLAALFGRVLRPLDPARTVAGIAPRPLLVVASPDDARIPAHAAQLMFDAAGEPKRIIWMSGAHMRTRETELLAQLTDSTLRWAAATLPGPGWDAPPPPRRR